MATSFFMLKNLNTGESFIAPTDLIDSGHRSRTSITHGLALKKASHRADNAVKNWGDVPIIRSVLIRSPVKNEVTPKLI